MFFSSEVFTHPTRCVARFQFEGRLETSRYRLSANDCYQYLGLPTASYADHAAYARVLTEASGLLEEIEEGRHAGPIDGPECLIETAADFLAELKSRM